MTNKPLLPLSINPNIVEDDTIIWNNKIKKLSESQNESATWYNVIWLISECYMYRRIAQEFLLT
jgi:hypothetical protein